MENLNPIKLFLNRIYHFIFIERFNKKLKFRVYYYKNKEFMNIKTYDQILDVVWFKNYLLNGYTIKYSFKIGSS